MRTRPARSHGRPDGITEADRPVPGDGWWIASCGASRREENRTETFPMPDRKDTEMSSHATWAERTEQLLIAYAASGVGYGFG